MSSSTRENIIVLICLWINLIWYELSGGFAIDKSKPTIVTKDEFYQNLIGQRASYTAEDTDNINLLYSYSNSEVDPNNCNCNTLEFRYFDKQDSRNGLYFIDKSEVFFKNLLIQTDLLHGVKILSRKLNWIVGS